MAINTPTQTSSATQQTAERAHHGLGLLLAGVIVGPLFIITAVTQMLLRPGFNLAIHPLSALSLGPWGWIQITNFILGGVLAIVAAVGFRTRLRGEAAGLFGPIFVGLFGLGLIVSGCFKTDGAFGFPAGSPAGMPLHTSWHSVVHNTAAQFSFAVLAIACLFFVRRFALKRQIPMMIVSIATPVAVALTLFAPGSAGFSLRLFVGVLILLVWLAIVSAFIATRERTTSSSAS